MSAEWRKLQAKLDEQANKIADLVEANDLERKTILEISRTVRHGHKCMDLKFRKDAQEYIFEADWVARLFRFNPLIAEQQETE